MDTAGERREKGRWEAGERLCQSLAQVWVRERQSAQRPIATALGSKRRVWTTALQSQENSGEA